MEEASLLQCPALFEHAAKRGVNSALLSSKKKTISLLSKGASPALTAEAPPNTSVSSSSLSTKVPVMCPRNKWTLEKNSVGAGHRRLWPVLS
jgi:hypothetical protein